MKGSNIYIIFSGILTLPIRKDSQQKIPWVGEDVFLRICFHLVTDFRLEVDRQGKSYTKPRFTLFINSVLDHSGSFWFWNLEMSPY